MSTRQDPPISAVLHLRGHLHEVAAVLRHESMNLLVRELISLFVQENYRLHEFIDALADYSDSMSGWEEVTKHLELASEELSKIQRESGKETS